MTEKEAWDYIESWDSYRIVPGLDSVRRLCRAMGDPQEQLRIVHIAGTDGKGSVLHDISSVLRAAGYRVGTYESPTITDYRERFRIGGRPISRAELFRCLEQLKETVDRLAAETDPQTGLPFPQPTAFERETALAFRWFADKKCDIAVIECGMGGLLDATNIISAPLASVITAIGMDHMRFLGRTLPEIAAQKAGIIKEGRPVFTTCQPAEVREVLEKAAAAKQAVLTVADPAEKTRQLRIRLQGTSFTYLTQSGEKLRISTPLAGTFQADNAVLALSVLEYLKENGFPFTDRQLQEGMRTGGPWPGRFEVISKKPLLILDGAHNEMAAGRLAETIRTVLPGQKCIFIIGVLADKEYDKVLRQTAALAEQIITVTPPGNKRALPAVELAKTAMEICAAPVTAADSLEEALELARLLAGQSSAPIIGFGSLSWLGRMRVLVNGARKKRRKSSAL
jgi:dihydrofolate synthase/folylpolyglutamate synthase